MNFCHFCNGQPDWCVSLPGVPESRVLRIGNHDKMKTWHLIVFHAGQNLWICINYYTPSDNSFTWILLSIPGPCTTQINLIGPWQGLLGLSIRLCFVPHSHRLGWMQSICFLGPWTNNECSSTVSILLFGSKEMLSEAAGQHLCPLTLLQVYLRSFMQHAPLLLLYFSIHQHQQTEKPEKCNKIYTKLHEGVPYKIGCQAQFQTTCLKKDSIWGVEEKRQEFVWLTLKRVFICSSNL